MILHQLTCWKSFSQIVTNDSTTDVRLKKTTAIKVVQDLLRYDELKSINGLTNQKILIYDSIVKLKDQTINDQRATIGRMEMMFQNQTAISNDYQKKIAQYEKQIRRERFHKWIAIIGSVVVSGATVYFLK